MGVQALVPGHVSQHIVVAGSGVAVEYITVAVHVHRFPPVLGVPRVHVNNYVAKKQVSLKRIGLLRAKSSF